MIKIGQKSVIFRTVYLGMTSINTFSFFGQALREAIYSLDLFITIKYLEYAGFYHVKDGIRREVERAIAGARCWCAS